LHVLAYKPDARQPHHYQTRVQRLRSARGDTRAPSVLTVLSGRYALAAAWQSPVSALDGVSARRP